MVWKKKKWFGSKDTGNLVLEQVAIKQPQKIPQQTNHNTQPEFKVFSLPSVNAADVDAKSIAVDESKSTRMIIDNTSDISSVDQSDLETQRITSLINAAAKDPFEEDRRRKKAAQLYANGASSIDNSEMFDFSRLTTSNSENFDNSKFRQCNTFNQAAPAQISPTSYKQQSMAQQLISTSQSMPVLSTYRPRIDEQSYEQRIQQAPDIFSISASDRHVDASLLDGDDEDLMNSILGD